MTPTIRDATANDAATIARFNAAMALETENKTLDLSVLEAGVSALLADRSKGRYWVADSDGEIAGQIMVTYEWSDWRNGMIWWIQSVYIAKAFRRRGVFTALYRHVERLAQDNPDCCGMRLYVEHQNARAQRTYEALGMVKPGYEVMEVDFRNAHTEESTDAEARK